MLSPATFIGIANASGAVGQPGPVGGRAAGIQPARVLTTPPVAAPIMQPSPKSGMTASPNQQAAPPRNLPRGSLLDINV
jgi:hypothetical protein